MSAAGARRFHAFGCLVLFLQPLPSGCEGQSQPDDGSTAESDGAASLQDADIGVEDGAQIADTSVDLDTSAPASRPCGVLGVPCPDDFACRPLEKVHPLLHGHTEYCYRKSDKSVFVPSGKFWMGCVPAKENIYPWCDPVGSDTYLEFYPFLVDTPAYVMLRTPVSNGEYRECVDDPRGACQPRSDGLTKFSDPPVPDNTEVWSIQMSDAAAYCRWLGALPDAAASWRLCSEAEWEKAARGDCTSLGLVSDLEACRDAGRLYPWGDAYPSCDIVHTVFECDTWHTQTAGIPVDSDPQAASPYGALGMWGRSHELMADCQASALSPAFSQFPPTDGSAWDHDCEWWDSKKASITRILRGGGYAFKSAYSDALSRRDIEPDTAIVSQFRCCADFVP